jgi:hypothetical protein
MLSLRLNSSLGLTALVLLLTAGNAAADQLSHFPSPQENWTRADYVNFYFAHYNGNRALPHLRSEDSARLFNHIVNRQNVLRILGTSASEQLKRNELAVILATMGEIRAAYGYALFVGEPLQEELVKVQSFMLFLIDASVKLESGQAGEFAASSAWKTTLWNVLRSLNERQIYSGRQIAELAAAVSEHYPRIAAILNASEKQQLGARIAELAATEADPEPRRALSELLHTIRSY